ncbi:MAG: hypothetical protein K6G03_01350 [Lachnospiraceae bacterium]|nr:hypothetical protein [Lachnospiraceae bacterium]
MDKNEIRRKIYNEKTSKMLKPSNLKTSKLLIVILICLMMCTIGNGGSLKVYAFGDTVSDNLADTVSDDDILGDITKNIDIPVMTVSENEEAGISGRRTFQITAEDSGSGIALIQAENIDAGVRSTLFQNGSVSGNDINKKVVCDLIIAGNGSYRVFAYDGTGNAAVYELEVSDIMKYTPDRYNEMIKRNKVYSKDEEQYGYNTEVKPVYNGVAVFGGNKTNVQYDDTNKNNSYVYRKPVSVLPTAGIGIYDDWSMLKKKEDNAAERNWSGDDTDSEPINEGSVQEEEADHKSRLNIMSEEGQSPFEAETSEIGEMIIESSVPPTAGGSREEGISSRKIAAAIIMAFLVLLPVGGIFLFSIKKDLLHFSNGTNRAFEFTFRTRRKNDKAY